MKCSIETLIAGLEAGRDRQQVLEELRLSPAQAMRMLESKRGRRMLAARRRLSRIGAMLLAQRFSPQAIRRLCHLLSDEKAEVGLKGITTLLAVVGLDGKARKERGTRPGSPVVGADAAEPSAEDGEVMEGLAELLNGKRAAGEGKRPEKVG